VGSLTCQDKIPQLKYEVRTARCWTGFNKEGLIVAKKKRGIYADPPNTPQNNLDDKVADFSYQSDPLADLIVECWTVQTTLDQLTTGSYASRKGAAKAALAARGIYIDYPIVVTEDEYEDGFSLQDAGLPANKGIVFVLPRKERTTTTAPAKPLLETAKMLMALTPNGI
jgi:hypothetical protein